MIKKDESNKKRSKQLKLQFNSNYENLARDIFNNFDKDTKMDLLNNEFYLDKNLYRYKNRDSKLKPLSSSDVEYLYSASYTELSNKDSKTHIRHNLYRTISAYLLDCSQEEKISVLISATKVNKKQINKLKEAAESRLSTLDKYMQQTLVK